MKRGEELAKCPKCETEIDRLNNIQSGCNAYDCWLADDKNSLNYQHEEFYADDHTNIWECPECQATLFGNEEDAIKFLRGE